MKLNLTSCNSTGYEGRSEFTLIVSNDKEITSSMQEYLSGTGILSIVANTENKAIEYLFDERISYILVDSDLPCISGNKFIASLKSGTEGRYVPIIVLASTNDEEILTGFMRAGCDDILFRPFTPLSLKTRIFSFNQVRELKQLYSNSLNEQIVARRILTNAIDERNIHFDEIGILSRAKAVFSGDLFLTARHPDGSLNILLGDFTGHGLSAAIGALPVSDIFTVMSRKGFSLERILESINIKLNTLLPTSMFMACSIMNVSRDLTKLDIWNGGMPDIYIREKNSCIIRHRIKSSNIPLGISDKDAEKYKIDEFDIEPGDLLVLYTDGLTEALNHNDRMFGQERLEECLKINCDQKSVFVSLVDKFNDFCGNTSPVDDVTLACIPCISKLMHPETDKSINYPATTCTQDNSWRWYMEIVGSALYEMNPIPMAIQEIQKISGKSENSDQLLHIMSILYENAIAHESVNTDIKTDLDNRKRENNNTIYIKIGIKNIYHNGMPSVFIQMEDSGKEIANNELTTYIRERTGRYQDLFNPDNTLKYEIKGIPGRGSRGNSLEAIIQGSNQKVL